MTKPETEGMIDVLIKAAGVPSEFTHPGVAETVAAQIVAAHSVESIAAALVRNAEDAKGIPNETSYARSRETNRRIRSVVLRALQAACVKRAQAEA